MLQQGEMRHASIFMETGTVSKVTKVMSPWEREHCQPELGRRSSQRAEFGLEYRFLPVDILVFGWGWQSYGDQVGYRFFSIWGPDEEHSL